MSKVWFITGASSGFGRLTAEICLKNGDAVVATLRKPEVLDDLKAQYPATRLLVLKLDVKNAQEITDAFSRAKEVFGRLDVVLNNAGTGFVGEIESTPDHMARSVVETDFWGAANVSREAVKFFREVNKPVGGRLLTVGSFGGLTALLCAGYYTAAKHAIEGFTETLAQELDPDWNIKVTLIEPGWFATAAVTGKATVLPAHPAYTKPGLPVVAVRSALENLNDPNNKFGNAEKAAHKFYELASLPDPPLRLILGQDAIEIIRSKMKSVASDIENFEAWSSDLL